MNPGAAPALDRFRIVFSSRDVEESRSFLHTRKFRLEIAAGEAAHFNMRLSGVFLPNVYLGTLQYGAAAEITADSSFDYHRFATPIHGSFAAVAGPNEIGCKPGQGVLLSPTLGGLVRSQRDHFGMTMFLSDRALHRHLAALLGEPPKAPLEFAPALDVARGYGRGVVGYARRVIADIDGDSLLMNPITIDLFEQFLMLGLLLAHPHSYSLALDRPHPWVAPPAVNRAIDFIEANLAEPIGLADIVTASGIPGRTLSEHFRRFRETTPMRYLHRARLARVRAALQRAEPGESVTDVAVQWGFSHLGRFAAQYRSAFGETPSETLAKGRPRSRL
jgi:AraC-like DNA-binding protein